MVTMVSTWFLVAFLTEALTEILKNVFPSTIKDKVTYGTSIAVGIALAYAFSLNVFGLTGLAAHASIIAAGMLASRGANYVNGFLKELGILKSNGT
ncbi:hypothetical protein [Brevibacillus laterosporus]|uniref:hypothetical protein n=1 Tax=Brevibacillus laterosporus TaxID=1465 RepID=UPI003D1E701A